MNVEQISNVESAAKAKKVPSVQLPENVGVLGGGRMGGGIAHAFLMAGAHVTVVEQNSDSAAAAKERIIETVDSSLKRGFVGDREELVSRLETTADIAGFAECGLVVEAVPELLELKLESLQTVAEVVAADAVIATNTSSIPLSKLGEAIDSPERFVGLHFFNPVPASKLIEVVVTDKTAPELVTKAQGWVAALGKTAVTVTDSPGFASSRLGVAIALEAMRMVEDGVASPADIDAAMELGYRHPVGPLKTTDIVGLDVRLGIAELLEEELGERFSPPKILRQMVADGKLGRKSGKGFYDWAE